MTALIVSDLGVSKWGGRDGNRNLGIIVVIRVF